MARILRQTSPAESTLRQTAHNIHQNAERASAAVCKSLHSEVSMNASFPNRRDAGENLSHWLQLLYSASGARILPPAGAIINNLKENFL